MEVISGKIIQLDERGMLIAADYANIDRAELRQYSVVEIGLPDGRRVTPEQRRKAHALIAEIADWMGDVPEYVKKLMKLEFIASRMSALEKALFSLSDCDVTTAREFISYLITFVVYYEIPTRVPLYELCEDIEHYVYVCAERRICAVCGKPKADLHHVDKVGMGNDRTQVDHVGRRAITLCRAHHAEVESIGDSAFFEKYHLEPIVLTAELVKKLKLRGKRT